MKKILFIGIGKKNDPKQRLIKALEKNNLDHIYAKWSDLSFRGQRVFIQTREINFDEIGAAFFDIPRLSIMTAAQTEIEFDFENELQILLSILKEKNIYAPNRDFLLAHPYYNKFSQAYIFNRHNIPSIPTLHLGDNKLEKLETLLEKMGLGFPLIAKESRGGQGKKVWKLENRDELEKFIENRRNINVLFQPYIKNDADYRVIIIHNECMGIMKRSAKKGEWKNNFSLGGIVSRQVDPAMEKFSLEACRKMNLDIAGLDVFHTDAGYLLIEANLFFGLDGFESVFPEINVSEKILSLLIKNIKK